MTTTDPCGCNCDTALEKLYLFLDSEIDQADCQEIQSHIDSCQDCLTEYDLERLVKMLVSRSCRESAPEPLRSRVMIAIRQVQVEIRQTPLD